MISINIRIIYLHFFIAIQGKVPILARYFSGYITT